MAALSPDLILAAAPFGALAVNVLVQVAALRLARGSGFARSVLVGAAGGAAALVALFAAVASAGGLRQPVQTALVLAGGYLGLSCCYFGFLNLNQTALRVRMLKEVAAAPGEALAVAELLRRYNAQSVIDVRLERLLGSGHLVRAGERYLPGRRVEFLTLARLQDLARRILYGGKGSRPPILEG